MVAAGLIPSSAEVTQPLPADTRVMEPIPDNVRRYSELAGPYRELYGRLPRL
jgi:sugar (pentulose or hexulose) kinase